MFAAVLFNYMVKLKYFKLQTVTQPPKISLIFSISTKFTRHNFGTFL